MGRMRRECSLCGGRLEKNICVECGLDNSKNDERYVSLGKTHKESDSMTHVHTKYEPFAGKTVTKEWVKTHKPGKKEKSKSKIVPIIVVIVLFGNMIPAFFAVLSNLFYKGVATPEVWQEEVVDDPYMFVVAEIPEAGVDYAIELGAGTYKGGVHIPSGVYEVSFLPEEGVEDCYAELTMNDAYNGIYQSFYFSDAEQLYDISDFRIYHGGIMELAGRGTLYFHSENAQTQDVYYQENPNTQVYNLSEQAEVGYDIPEGVYDVYCEEGAGFFAYEVQHAEGYMIYCEKLLGDQESGFASVVRNVVLPRGTMIYMDGLDVKLVPSETIESEDYQSFYENY